MPSAPRAIGTWAQFLYTSLHHRWWQGLNRIADHDVVPFSPRYWWTRERLVVEVCQQTLADPAGWPRHIGQRRFRYYDERIVEYSWALSRLARLGPRRRFLDVGCVMNTTYALGRLLDQFSDIHFLNLVSEPLAIHGRISFHSQDIRACDLPRASFDAVTCISTLEHVGGDNAYNDFSPNGTAEITSSSLRAGACWPPAFAALLDLLAPGGLLLVSMPFGRGGWRGGEYELGPDDLTELRRLVDERQRGVTLQIVRKTDGGWRPTTPEEEPGPLSVRPAGADAVALLEVT